MPPWKIDKKAWAKPVRTPTRPFDEGYSFVENLINFCNINLLSDVRVALSSGMTKKTQPAATWGRRNLGVDLDLALT